MADGPDIERVSLLALFTPALERWRVMVAVPLAVAVVTAVAVLLQPREWRASMALSTIMTTRDMPLAGGLSTLLNAGNLGGLQPTPALIVRLSQQYGVLYSTAMAPMPGTSGTVLDRLRQVEGRVPERRIVATMSDLVHTSADKQTGVITLDVVSRDSALARAIANTLVDEVSSTFVRSSRAQAREVREAMQARVDSAQRALHNDEERLRRFQAANRQIREFSEAYFEQQRLARAVSISQTTYTQAVADREEAVGKELEETPAVVVVDPLPEQLLPVSRRLVVKVIVAGLLAASLTWLALLAWTSLGSAARRDPDSARFVSALASLPAIGRPFARLLPERSRMHVTGAQSHEAPLRKHREKP